MTSKPERTISRREFAQRAAMLSATASLVPAGVIAQSGTVVPAQNPAEGPKLDDAGQAEVESRCQQILSLYSNRLDDAQKADVKRLCAEMQPMLERVRGYALENGQAPALYLKPLVERPKKPRSAAKPQPGATSKKP
jgi:hypothetical protein